MTTIDVDEAFVHLQNAPRPTGSALNTRALLKTEHGDVLIAIDSEGLRHVLVPTPATHVDHDLASRALSLTGRQLQDGTTLRLYSDVACLDTRLSLVFERVVSDVVRRLDAGADPSTVCHSSLQDWRALFQAARAGTSDEVVVGLIGELELLAQLGRAIGQSKALKSWWGPEGHVHDFYNEADHAIEVKTTRSLDGNRVSISNLDQLDQERVTALHLCVYAIRPDVKAPTLDQRIRTLMEDGYGAHSLLEKVAGTGHVFEGPTVSDTRFSVRSQKIWNISKSFPGLKRSELGDNTLRGISNVKFDLLLESVGKPTDDSDIDGLLASWGSK